MDCDAVSHDAGALRFALPRGAPRASGRPLANERIACVGGGEWLQQKRRDVLDRPAKIARLEQQGLAAGEGVPQPDFLQIVGERARQSHRRKRLMNDF